MSLGEKVKHGKHIWVDLEKVFLQLIGTFIWQCVFVNDSRQAFFKLFAEPISNPYFFNKEELVKYVAASEASKAYLPGSAYICKIFTFMKTHYQFGKVYIT